MKGLELPINMIVVVAIAVLVLVVVAAFFSGWFIGGGGSISTATAWSTGCNTLRSVYGCETGRVSSITITGYNPDNKPVTAGTQYTGESLLRACKDNFKTATMTDADCARSCGCGV